MMQQIYLNQFVVMDLKNYQKNVIVVKIIVHQLIYVVMDNHVKCIIIVVMDHMIQNVMNYLDLMMNLIIIQLMIYLYGQNVGVVVFKSVLITVKQPVSTYPFSSSLLLQ